MMTEKLHCPLCAAPLEDTLEEILKMDFRIRCLCGFDVYLEDAHYNPDYSKIFKDKPE